MLPMFVGEAVATQMLLTGEMIDAQRAREIQLVTESVDLDYRPQGQEFLDMQHVNGVPVPALADMEEELLRTLFTKAGRVPGVVLRALELALTISANAPLAVRGTVRTMRSRQEGRFIKDAGNGDHAAASNTLFERQLRMEAREQGLSWESPDFELGLAAMAAKRKPVFPSGLYGMPEVEHELIRENEQHDIYPEEDVKTAKRKSVFPSDLYGMPKLEQELIRENAKTERWVTERMQSRNESQVGC